MAMSRRIVGRTVGQVESTSLRKGRRASPSAVGRPTRQGRLFSAAWIAALAIMASSAHGAVGDGKYKTIGASWSTAVTWYYAPDGQPGWASPSNMVPLVQKAMDTWSAQCGVQFSYLGTTARQSTVEDGASVIGWLPSMSSGANTSYYFRGGQMTEADVQLNVGANGSELAAFPLILHELGHVIGLDHSAVTSAVMAGPPAAQYSYATSLAPDDVAACQSLYGPPTRVAASQPPAAASPAPGTPRSGPVPDAVATEFYHPVLDHYFMTANPAETASLMNGGPDGQWRATGFTFKVWSSAQAGLQPMCRFYGDWTVDPATGKRRGPDSHFYTASAQECGIVPQKWPVWVFEGDTFYAALPDANGACPAGMQPVSRFFRPQGDPNHRYTTNEAVKADMTARGWIPEGATWCAGA